MIANILKILGVSILEIKKNQTIVFLFYKFPWNNNNNYC